jgi:DNA-binding response OmpR family regulator
MRIDRSVAQLTPPTGVPRAHGRLRVAVIDHDRGFMQVLSKRLEMADVECRLLARPVAAHALVRMRLNAVVVDVAMVGPGAWEYLGQICGRLPGLAVVVCSGPSSVAQRVRGLRLGADAWITKPCHAEEVVSVIEAVVRRHRRQDLGDLATATTVGEITIRPDRHQVFVDGHSAQLTAREFEILRLLAQSPVVLRREEIYERVWGYAMAHGDRSVDVFVRKVRQKLQTVSPSWSYIHTHFGVGYRFGAALQHDAECPAAPSMREQHETAGDAVALEPLTGSEAPDGGSGSTRLIVLG